MTTASGTACRPKAAGAYWLAEGPKGAPGWRLRLVERNKLPRGLSLTSSVEIQQLLRRGARISGDLFVCVWEKSDRFAYGVFVPRKYGTAPARNRFKRLMREAIRLNRQRLTQPVKIGLLPRRDMGKLTFDRVDTQMQRTFEQINARLH